MKSFIILLALNVVLVGYRQDIAVCELLSLFDRSSGPVHNVAAVRDLIHAGVACVVDQTAGQMHAIAKCNARRAKSVVICLEQLDVLAVEEYY